MNHSRALIVGAGAGLSASLGRLFARNGMTVALASRTPDAEIAASMGAKAYACDASKPDEVDRLFADIERDLGTPDVVVYNASYRARGPVAELDPAEVAKALSVTAFGGFLVAQAAAKRMLPRGEGAILLT